MEKGRAESLQMLVKQNDNRKPPCVYKLRNHVSKGNMYKSGSLYK